ncbi:MAG: nucleotide-binding enzyme [Myxococcota bacterium]
MSDRRSRRGPRGERTRLLVAREAAALMYREGVRQYFDAKRIAARRVLGSDIARHRPHDLPSNGEIREQLLALVSLAEGADREQRLVAMRLEALTVLRELAPWHARLIGSVWSGHARRGSDIDVHVFGDRDGIERALHERGWVYEHEEVLIRIGAGFRAYHHLHVLERPFPVELSVYDLAERRDTTRSSVSGQAIDRVSPARLEARIRAEHGRAWARWCETGDLGFEEGPEAGAFDGLLRELDEGD